MAIRLPLAAHVISRQSVSPPSKLDQHQQVGSDLSVCLTVCLSSCVYCQFNLKTTVNTLYLLSVYLSRSFNDQFNFKKRSMIVENPNCIWRKTRETQNESWMIKALLRLKKWRCPLRINQAPHIFQEPFTDSESRLERLAPFVAWPEGGNVGRGL